MRSESIEVTSVNVLIVTGINEIDSNIEVIQLIVLKTVSHSETVCIGGHIVHLEMGLGGESYLLQLYQR